MQWQTDFMKYSTRLIRKHWQLYLVITLPCLYIFIFHYLPMGGLLLAFKDFNIRQGIIRSPWAGFKYFKQFFSSPIFWPLLKNTLGLSLYSLAAGFPVPIILAIALNEVSHIRFKKTVQMVTYAPYFISTVVMVSIIMQFLDPRIGPVNTVIKIFGNSPVNFMGEAAYFKTIYVLSGIWQLSGYGAIVYIAALSGIDPALHEAARVDGASRLQKIIHIDLPGIAPTIVIMLILNIGQIMSIGFEKVYLMQNALNQSSSEIIATYVYKVGLLGAQFSFSTAVSFFNSIINFILIFSVNKIVQRMGGTSLW